MSYTGEQALTDLGLPRPGFELHRVSAWLTEEEAEIWHALRYPDVAASSHADPTFKGCAGDLTWLREMARVRRLLWYTMRGEAVPSTKESEDGVWLR